MCVWNTECFQKSFVLIFMCDFVVTGMYVFLMRVKICVKLHLYRKNVLRLFLSGPLAFMSNTLCDPIINERKYYLRSAAI